MPTEFPCRFRHRLSEVRSAQRWHRVFARAWSLEDIAPLVDLALDVAGLARHAALGEVGR
jgi:hypothetical protein